MGFVVVAFFEGTKPMSYAAGLDAIYAWVVDNEIRPT